MGLHKYQVSERDVKLKENITHGGKNSQHCCWLEITHYCACNYKQCSRMGILEQTKIVWQLNTRFPGAKFIHNVQVQLLLLAFEDPEITVNVVVCFLLGDSPVSVV
jgi:hypothetical protein